MFPSAKYQLYDIIALNLQVLYKTWGSKVFFKQLHFLNNFSLFTVFCTRLSLVVDN